MAKFCMYCGRPLAEGEVCNCQNNANTQETAPQTADTNTQANAPAAEANVQPDNTNAQAQTAAQNDYNQGANPNQNFIRAVQFLIRISIRDSTKIITEIKECLTVLLHSRLIQVN